MIRYRCPNKHIWDVARAVDVALTNLPVVPCPECKEPMRRNANKYHNEVVILDGYRFASMREAERYKQLIALKSQGLIRDLQLQPVFLLTVNSVKVGKYIGDFQYFDVEKAGVVVEDAKGYRTRDYALKRKLVKALYGVTISEV